jgi:hypothetical protein
MSKAIFFKALDATSKIESSLKQSTFAEAHGTAIVRDLMEYRIDIALDIYKIFAPTGTDFNSEQARKQQHRWYSEYFSL